ncbi:hypothetical protein, partial [Reyranella sp.]|uniref:hypothetical protein n=1 Tax=Reyranella sp. TaxID=1929291 RepID=UPI0027316179
ERPPPQGGRLQIGIGGRLPSEQLAGFKSESPADFKSEWVADLLRNPQVFLNNLRKASFLGLRIEGRYDKPMKAKFDVQGAGGDIQSVGRQCGWA